MLPIQKEKIDYLLLSKSVAMYILSINKQSICGLLLGSSSSPNYISITIYLISNFHYHQLINITKVPRGHHPIHPTYVKDKKQTVTHTGKETPFSLLFAPNKFDSGDKRGGHDCLVSSSDSVMYLWF